MNPEVEIKRIGSKNLVGQLRDRANKSPTFKNMAHVFAIRERTRQQISLNTLFMSMTKEGFKFSKADYARELEFLASVGIGRIDRDTKGRLRSLNGITVTLQSIGLASVSNKDKLEKFTPAIQFTKLPEILETPPASPKVPDEGVKALLIMEINGQRKTLATFLDITPLDLLNLVVELTNKKESK